MLRLSAVVFGLLPRAKRLIKPTRKIEAAHRAVSTWRWEVGLYNVPLRPLSSHLASNTKVARKDKLRETPPVDRHHIIYVCTVMARIEEVLFKKGRTHEFFILRYQEFLRDHFRSSLCTCLHLASSQTQIKHCQNIKEQALKPSRAWP